MLLSPWNWKARDESGDIYQSFYATPNKKDTQWVVDQHGVIPDANTCKPSGIGAMNLPMVAESDKQ